MLYEMLTTRRPMHKGAAAPSASNPHVLQELDELVLRAVAPNPDLRIQTAATLAAELRSVLAMIDVRGGAGDEDDPPEPTSVGRIVALAAVLLVVLVLAAYLIF
jgi:hypothetical protein